jgi:metal-sulfur cluster biosynthetic enzyme
MRTTINIDEQLLMYAKLQATKQGCTLKQVIEDALREFFSRHSIERDQVKLETVSGAGLGLKPGVNLDDGRSLNEIMEGR